MGSTLLKKYNRAFFIILWLVTFSIFTASPRITEAQSPAKSSEADFKTSSSFFDGWKVRFAPYAWATALNGTVGVKGVNSKVHMSIGDVLSHVDGGLMFDFELKKDRWSLITDLVYASLSDSSPSPKGILFTDADADLQQVLWTQAIAYTFYQDTGVTFDVLGGFRMNSLNLDLDINGATLPNGESVDTRSFSRDKTWLDPIVGARNRISLSNDFFLLMNGYVGGFNASSAFTWNAQAAFGYKVAEDSSIGIGYRGLGYNYDRDGFKYNVDMYGPFIGGEFKF